MKHNLKKSIILAMLGIMMLGTKSIHAQNFRYETRFYFHLDKYDIDESLNGNDRAVDSILYKLRDLKSNSNVTDLQLHITSYASLEASDQYNFVLAGNRTNALRNFLKKFVLLNDVPIITDPNIFDWETLINMTLESECPYREEALRIMREPELNNSGNIRKSKLEELGGGITYNYMRQHFFPLMRNSALTITANVPVVQQPVVTQPVEIPAEVEYVPKERKKIHAALSSNLLYDAVTLGNLGLDVYLGGNISMGANWMYTWWKDDDKKFYWRAYGGDIHGDYWFDTTNLWHGHHLGLYAQMLTFDVEYKGTGYQGPKWLYGGGVSYGYAIGLGKTGRWTLDLGIGLGYLGGKYYVYDPSYIRDKYLYYETKHLNWVGPTSAKVSLVWNFDL